MWVGFLVWFGFVFIPSVPTNNCSLFGRDSTRAREEGVSLKSSGVDESTGGQEHLSALSLSRVDFGCPWPRAVPGS